MKRTPRLKRFPGMLLGLVLCVPASAAMISMPRTMYRIESVPLAFAGCAGPFGRQLQADLSASRLEATVAASYDTARSFGQASVQLNNGSDLWTASSLSPLGIQGKFLFGHWWRDRIITLNDHRYHLYGVTFEAHGDNAEDWVRHGVVQIMVTPEQPVAPTPPETATFACPLSSGWVNESLTGTRGSLAEPPGAPKAQP